jgi:CheY-like chemotaxis protein
MKHPKNVLVVDDAPQVREFLFHLLQADGFEVFVCEHGISALEAAIAKNFDIIVTDYRMPYMNGVEVTKHLRARLPASVIIGISMENVQEAFLGAGADAFLFKPFKYDDLLKLTKMSRSNR